MPSLDFSYLSKFKKLEIQLCEMVYFKPKNDQLSLIFRLVSEFYVFDCTETII